MADDRIEQLEKRYERLDKLLSILSHGEAKITWADGKIIKVEKIVTEAIINK
jgi:hypothetical protein